MIHDLVQENGTLSEHEINAEVEILKIAKSANVRGIPKFLGYETPSSFIIYHFPLRIIGMEYIPNTKTTNQASRYIKSHEKLLLTQNTLFYFYRSSIF